MADNVNLTAGDGTIVAGSDKIAGVDYPRVKVNWGPDGTVNDADVATGKPLPVQLRGSDGTDVSNTLPVSIASVPSHAVTNAGTFATQSAQSGTWTVQPGNTANTTAWKVDGSAVTQPVSGTVTASIAAGATTIAKAEDVASADADVGVPAMMVRKATPANTSGTDGDYEMLQGSAGRLWVDPSGVTLTVGSHAVTNAGTFAVQAACAGDVASGSSDSGNPVKAGAVAHTAAPTAVTDGQRVNVIADKVGKLIAVGAIRDLKGITQTQISNSTSETTIVAAVASTFMDLYGLILANTGATTTKVTIKDSTAGTTRAIIEVPTLETRGFMLPVDSAIPQATVNNNWTATCAAATTAMEVTAMWVKNI